MGYYPIIVDLTDASCLIVGGGEVAFRKAVTLREAGAQVKVITRDACARLEHMDGVTVECRDYAAGDVSGHALVFAATDDRQVNSLVSREAAEHGIPVNVVDDPELCSFIVPSVMRRGDLLMAVCTSGKSPGLSKKIRCELEEHYGPEYGEFVELMGEMRQEVKARYSTQKEREAVFGKLINSGILELLRQGEKEEAGKKARECIL